LPDWKHKVSDVKLNGYLDLWMTFKGQQTTVRDWFTNLQDAVTHWLQEARAAEVPDFNKTVSEYTSQSTTLTCEASDSSLIKELRVLPSVPKLAARGGKQSRGPVMQIKEAMEKHLNQGGARVV
jgi:hypothetical protein